jgi:hypothetical protein
MGIYKNTNMITQTPLFIIAFAGLLHASFQLGVSLLTLLSGHSLGSGRSHHRLMQLNLAYLAGAATITVLLFGTLAYIGSLLVNGDAIALWYVLSLLNMVIGLSVMVFYYRHQKGTGLWIPRPLAVYLAERTKKTKKGAEAFILGAGSVLAEIPFLVGPVSIAVLYSLTAASEWQFSTLFTYALVSLFPLFTIVGLVGAGHKISTIQRWREDNKLFLQYCAGSGLIILGAFVFVDKVIGGTL